MTKRTDLLQDYICFYCAYGRWCNKGDKIQFRCEENATEQPIEYGNTDCLYFVANQQDYQQP